MLRLALLALSLWILTQCGVPQQVQDSIRYGDTEQQVLQKVGKRPYYTYFDRDLTVWQYGGSTFSSSWYLVFESGRVVKRDYGFFNQASPSSVSNPTSPSIPTTPYPRPIPPGGGVGIPTPIPLPPSHVADEQWLDGILSQIDKAFLSDRMAIVERAVLTRAFTPRQAARVINKFSFNDDKQKALRLLVPALINCDDLSPLYEIFRFHGERQEVDQLVLSELKRRQQWQHQNHYPPIGYGQGSTSAPIGAIPPTYPFPVEAEEQWLPQLLGQIDKAFSDERLAVVERASLTRVFTPRQAARVINKFPFEDEKRQALRLLIPALIQCDDLSPLYKIFPFSDDKEEIDRLVLEMLKRRQEQYKYH